MQLEQSPILGVIGDERAGGRSWFAITFRAFRRDVFALVAAGWACGSPLVAWWRVSPLVAKGRDVTTPGNPPRSSYPRNPTVKRLLALSVALLLLGLAGRISPALADQSFADVAEVVNRKLVKVFGLGGFRGLDILAVGSPASQRVDCATGAPLDLPTPITTPGGNGLAYDPATGQYQLNWKTEKSWANTCRDLIVELTDATTHRARFSFTK